MNKQTMLPGLIDHELEQQALSLLQSAKYKEASKLIKKLLQLSDADEWHQKLADCYVQRALGFAATGMYKEALVLWENHKQHTQAPFDAYPQYLVWLTLTDNQEKIKLNLKQLKAEHLDKQYPDLAAVLGLLILTGHAELGAYLPQDSAFIAHLTLIRTALQAYQESNRSKLKEVLQGLPYRSAFRDLSILLKATVAMDSSDNQALTPSLLAKISADSVYFQAAKILLAATMNGSELVQELLQLSYNQRRHIGQIKGLTTAQMEFIEHFCRQHDNLSDKVQFQLALQYKLLLGNEFTQQFCQSLLAVYQSGKKYFNQNFPGVSEFEEHRVNALYCEQGNNLYDAAYYWHQCIDSLKNETAENGQKIALILRHMAEQEPEGESRTELLIDSLEFDPEDRDSFQQIIHYYSQQEKTVKSYNIWLKNTITQFPDDIEVLTQAVRSASKNKTYKKASQYALKILKIDPLNTFARQTLFSSYMAQARRLMQAKNYLLVDKEIRQAEKLKLGKAYTLQTQLMHALLCFAYADKQEGLKQITATLDSFHTDPVNIHLRAAIAALLNGLPVATLLRELAPVKEYLLSEQELAELTRQLNQHADINEDRECLHKALDKIKAPLKKSISEQTFAEQVLLDLCQVLDRIDHFELLRHSAKSAQLRWQQPIWVYYRIYAEHNSTSVDYSYLDVQRLQRANDKARKDKDYPTAMLLDKLLDAYFAEHPQQEKGFLNGLFGFDNAAEDEYIDSLDQLFEHLPDGVLIELNRAAEKLTIKITPETLIKEVVLQAGNNKDMLLAVMQNPDIFSALMLLRAADELNIDIDVDINDVIEVFAIADKKNLFPLPF